MREIFPPSEPPGAPAEPVFYTIRAADVGKGVIVTEAGPIRVRDFMGTVTVRDVGKRIYRTLMTITVTGVSADRYLWQVENDRQFGDRRAREHGAGAQ